MKRYVLLAGTIVAGVLVYVKRDRIIAFGIEQLFKGIEDEEPNDQLLSSDLLPAEVVSTAVRNAMEKFQDPQFRAAVAQAAKEWQKVKVNTQHRRNPISPLTKEPLRMSDDQDG